jgi:hypothetical protein
MCIVKRKGTCIVGVKGISSRHSLTGAGGCKPQSARWHMTGYHMIEGDLCFDVWIVEIWLGLDMAECSGFFSDRMGCIYLFCQKMMCHSCFHFHDKKKYVKFSFLYFIYFFPQNNGKDCIPFSSIGVRVNKEMVFFLILRMANIFFLTGLLHFFWFSVAWMENIYITYKGRKIGTQATAYRVGSPINPSRLKRDAKGTYNGWCYPSLTDVTLDFLLSWRRENEDREDCLHLAKGSSLRK